MQASGSFEPSAIPSQLQTLLFEALNHALHAAISVDPDTAKEFRGLMGKVFCIEMSLPPLTLYLVPEPDGLTLLQAPPADPDVTLSGSIFGFAKLSGKGAISDVIGSGQVTMQGDAEAGQALQKIFSRFDFDWEELIARMLGDTPARQIGNLLRDAGDQLKRSAELGRENLGDYLTEEKRVLVGKVAFERFEAELNDLRSDADRLAQRLERLQRKLPTD